MKASTIVLYFIGFVIGCKGQTRKEVDLSFLKLPIELGEKYAGVVQSDEYGVLEYTYGQDSSIHFAINSNKEIIRISKDYYDRKVYDKIIKDVYDNIGAPKSVKSSSWEFMDCEIHLWILIDGHIDLSTSYCQSRDSDSVYYTLTINDTKRMLNKLY